MRIGAEVAALVGLATLLAACGGEGRTPAVVVGDSAGVRIVELDRDRVPVRWHVSEQPEWVVGSGSAAHADIALFQVADVRLMSDGWVAIAERSTQQVILVEPQGGPAVRLGGRGTGPGELSGLQAVFEEEEGRIGVFDAGRSRYVVLDRDGTEVRGRDVPRPGASGPPTMVRSRDGSAYLVNQGGFPDGPSRSFRARTPVIRAMPPGDTVTWISGTETFREAGGMGGVMFGARAVLAGGARGVWIGDTAMAEAALWVEPGAPEIIVRWRSSGDRAVSAERRETFIAALLEAEDLPPEERAAGRRMLEAVPFADRMPAFGSLVTGPGDELWIGSYVPQDVAMLSPSEGSQEWLVVPATGQGAGRVWMPPGFTLSQVTDGQVIGVHTDELGVETVRAYRLVATGDGS